MANPMIEAARKWLESQGYNITFEKDGHTLIGSIREEHRHNSQGQPLGSETAVLVVTLATLASGIAQARLNLLVQWKARRKGRWIAVAPESGLTPSDLVALRGFDQEIRTGSGYPKQ
jgi:hypothetical protein